MMLFIIVCILFLLMFIFPIYIGLWGSKQIKRPLYIDQNYSKDPRYFANSFREKFEHAFNNNRTNNSIQLSKNELLVHTRKNRILPNSVIEAVVYASEKVFSPKPNIQFKKEIYVKNKAVLRNITEVRAISCLRSLTIGSGINIVRWADAMGVVNVAQNCNLGISTSSGRELNISKNCVFKRLYAPQINIAFKNNHVKAIVNPQVCNEIIYHIKFVDDMLVDKQGVLAKTIVSKHDVTVLDDYQVQGHIRSHNDIKLNSNVRVHGNLFAEGNIFLNNNVVVSGVVFAQGSIYIDNNVVIGQPNKIKSVVARQGIIIGHNCRVYGYIATEEIGYIQP